MKNPFGKTTLCTDGWDSTPCLPAIFSLVSCKSYTLDHAANKAHNESTRSINVLNDHHFVDPSRVDAEETFKMITRCKETCTPKPVVRDVGIMCSVTTRDVGVSHQSQNNRCRNSETQCNIVPLKIDAASQCEKNFISCANVGILAKPRCFDVGVDNIISAKDTASSDDSTPNVKCDKCQVKKRNISTGHHNVEALAQDHLETGKEPVSLSFLGVTKPGQVVIKSVEKDDTPKIVKTSTKCIDTSHFYASRRKDIAINTIKATLVDVAVGSLSRSFDKHDVAIQVDAQLTGTKKFIVHSPNYSRIPRPVTVVKPSNNFNEFSGAHTVLNEDFKNNRTLIKQETYSKLTVLDDESNSSRSTSVRIEQNRVIDRQIDLSGSLNWSHLAQKQANPIPPRTAQLLAAGLETTLKCCAVIARAVASMAAFDIVAK
ncbi:unnamed protein product [Timema podura]|uniref:DUF659 domain-containing protein n=1 Tax=Timema podura TaxID=61482 RepID=A0ABN7NHU6_TIMPD|nr:unnamed protein product [Timema podura]